MIWITWMNLENVFQRPLGRSEQDLPINVDLHSLPLIVKAIILQLSIAQFQP